MEKLHSQDKSHTLLLIAILMLAISTRLLPNQLANAEVSLNLGGLSLPFVPNLGQTDSSVLYSVRGLSGEIYFQSQNVLFSLPSSNENTHNSVQISFLGQNPTSSIQTLESLPTKINYFRGNDSSKWLTNIPSYQGIMYQGLYDGIDLRYFGTEGSLKSEFTVAAGVNPNVIRWQYLGAEAVWVDVESGDLLIRLANGDILREKSPIAWQDIEGIQNSVPVFFQVNAQQIVSFIIGDYDLNFELILDPVIEYSSFIGGSSSDEAFAVVADDEGNAYVVGQTLSSNFPTSVGALSSSRQGANDAFVMKIDTDATGIASLLWSSYLGGGGGESATGVAVDLDGNVYITGWTSSNGTSLTPAFPTTGNAYQPSYGPCCTANAFLVKLDSDATSLLYSSYLGGSSSDEASGIAVDSSGNAYITGTTSSNNFPTTGNAYLTTGTQGTSQIFISKIDTNASGAASLVYSTYINGNDTDVAVGIAADDSGNVFITGKTESTDFPVTASAYQSTLKTLNNGDGVDAFVLRIDTSESGSASLIYSSYFGGQFSTGGLTGADNFNTRSGSIATDGNGLIYITGETNSIDLPIVNGYQTSYRGGLMDAFLAKFDTDLSGTASLLYASYLGGNGYDKGYGISSDQYGNAYVIGVTQSTNFPILNGLSFTNGGFVTRINTNASGTASLLSSTRLGGSDANGIGSSFVDSFARVYSTGQVSGTTFPITDGFQSSYGGNVDAYVVRLSYYSDLRLTRTEPNTVPVGVDFSYTLTVTNLGGDYATNVILDETFSGAMTLESVNPSQGTCTPSALSYTCNLGNIPVNGTATVSVNINPTTAGTISKDATIIGVEVDNNSSNNTSNTNTSVVNSTDLAVTMSDSPDPVVATEELVYTVTISNNGDYDATNVILTDILPTNMSYISSNPSQGACNLSGSAVSCELGSILVGNSATVELTLSPSIAGTVINTVTVDSSEFDLVSANDSSSSTTSVLPPPPAVPTLLSPSSASTINNLRPTFTWNKPSSAVRFEIQIDTSLSFNNPAISTTATSFSPYGALLIETYYWRVRAFNSANVPSEWSNPNSVIIASPANSAPQLNYYTSSSPTLTWNSISWASQYEIQVDDNSNFTAPLEFSTIVSATELSVVATGLGEGTHYWRVRALNGTTIGTWSPSQTFMIDIP